jgi:hypothetical protein
MNLGNSSISITRISDGKTVEFVYPFDVHDDSTQDWSDWQSTLVFLWADGNYSCDCDRFLFFERALGKTEEEIDELDPVQEGGGDCGSYEKYRVNFIKNEAGKVLYEEKE